MKIADKIYNELMKLKKKISDNFGLDYEDVDLAFCEIETAIHYIFKDNTKDYVRIGNTPIRIAEIVKNPDQKKYMVMAYDYKQYTWRNADIFADNPETCIKIANIVFGVDQNPDPELNISIDYGTSDTDLIF